MMRKKVCFAKLDFQDNVDGTNIIYKDITTGVRLLGERINILWQFLKSCQDSEGSVTVNGKKILPISWQVYGKYFGGTASEAIFQVQEVNYTSLFIKQVALNS